MELFTNSLNYFLNNFFVKYPTATKCQEIIWRLVFIPYHGAEVGVDNVQAIPLAIIVSKM